MLTIDRRFRGPSSSGNGGYVAGMLAGEAPGPVRVVLKAAPPLDRPLALAAADGATELRDEGSLIATALHEPDAALAWVSPCSVDEAVAAESAYAGTAHHPFPQCFVCGTRRGADAMNLRPGPVAEGVTACTWSVTEELAGRPEFVWAALDCPGAWTAPSDEIRMVLGTITAQVQATPEPGEQCVIMGRRAASEGRKFFTETSVYGTGGRPLGRASSIWIALPEDAESSG